jgi:hypothetical protein
MRYYNCCIDRNLSHKVHFDRFLGFKILLFVFLIFLSFNNFNHIFKDTTLLTLLIKAMSCIFKKKLIGLEIDNTIVEGL